MPVVGDFDRLRCSGTGGLGIRARAVAADYPRPRMFGEPVGDGVGFAVGENIHGTVSAHVDQDRATPMSATEGEVVDAEHLDSGRGWIGSARTILNKVERPTETPSVDANLIRLVRPAQARSSPGFRVAAESFVRKPWSVRRSARQMCVGCKPVFEHRKLAHL